MDGESIWDQLKPKFRDVVVGGLSILGWNYMKERVEEYVHGYREDEKREIADEVVDRLKKDYTITPRDVDESEE